MIEQRHSSPKGYLISSGRGVGRRGVLDHFVPSIRSIGIGRGRADSDLYSNFASIHLLACKCLESLLLLFFSADVNESVTFAAAGAAETTAHDTSRDDVDTSRSEELVEGSVVNVESEISDKKD